MKALKVASTTLLIVILSGCASSFTLYDAEMACNDGKIKSYEHRTYRETQRLECAKDE